MSFGMVCLSSEDDDDGASGDVKNDDDDGNDVIWMMVRTQLYNLTTTATMIRGTFVCALLLSRNQPSRDYACFWGGTFGQNLVGGCTKKFHMTGGEDSLMVKMAFVHMW